MTVRRGKLQGLFGCLPCCHGLFEVRINDLAAPPEPMHPLMPLGLRSAVGRDPHRRYWRFQYARRYLEPFVAMLIIANGIMLLDRSWMVGPLLSLIAEGYKRLRCSPARLE